jgi:hypothetical protein
MFLNHENTYPKSFCVAKEVTLQIVRNWKLYNIKVYTTELVEHA